MIEEPATEELGVMCARCHSWARTALQRRTEADWLKHMHFHLGQWPTTEYQALGRDRNWWQIASEELPPKLAELFPVSTPEWDAWQDREAPDLSGAWRIVGHEPGRGDFHGVVTIEGTGEDTYAYALNATYADGEELSGEGKGILYTGYEWRSRTTIGGQVSLEVFALSEDGNTMTGRSFAEDPDAIGSRVTVARMTDGTSRVLGHPRPTFGRARAPRSRSTGSASKGTSAWARGSPSTRWSRAARRPSWSRRPRPLRARAR